ncbi:MAG: 16S rRNA (guanine(527)-N(7))-methyltransferase RsmG [Spirochaetes bacterium]|nr:16S rRNA (guanine(527)-N(7))-methyltransferase RsmG [Spirochaetota bacterium]
MDRRGLIAEIFREGGFSLSEEQLGLFSRFFVMLVSHNDAHDLTRITRPEDIIVKHFIDSVYVSRLMDLPSPLIDIGTGAGFPGIPLKIMNPDIRIILAEPRRRRVSFMETAIRELGLRDIEIYPHLVTDKSHFTVKGVITRALESSGETLERVDHFLPKDGLVILMKGPAVDSERADDVPGFALERDQAYVLPGTAHRRRLLVFRKTGDETARSYHIMRNRDEQQGIHVTSAENQRFRELRRLLASDGMKKAGLMILAGKRIIGEVIAAGRLPVRRVLLYDGYVEDEDLLRDAIDGAAERGELLILKKTLYNELDTAGTGGPLLVTDLPEMGQWDNDDVRGCLLAVAFQDPANVGAVIRSALGLGVRRILVLRESANPFHPKALRASAGAVLRADLVKGPSIRDLAAEASRRNVPVVALDSGGTPLENFIFPGGFILLPGLEGPGIPEELRAGSVSIPLEKTVESLNGPVAAAIALYRWRQRP